MSVRAFAAHLGVSERIVSKWEAGARKIQPRPVNQSALDVSLAASDQDVQTRFASALEAGHPLSEGVGYPPHQGPVAPELVMYFLEQLPGHYKADMWVGPRHLIPTVATQAGLIQQLARAADAPVRRGLLGAGVAYAELLGWLYQDCGDLDRAATWRAHALDMAHRSQDPQLIGYALTNHAMLAVDQGAGGAVVDYAEAALADEDRLCPKVRVLALVHQAHGHSMLPAKDKDLVDRLLDRAAELVPRVDDEHAWGNACRRSPGYIEVQRATAYLRLGAYREAVELWERVLSGMPESARRDNAVFRARQATALAMMPEPERVVGIVAEIASVATDTGSARMKRELKAIPRHATSWSGTAPGRELTEIIAQVA
jgi:tetratricopeptide (TPR) repeat protein